MTAADSFDAPWWLEAIPGFAVLTTEDGVILAANATARSTMTRTGDQTLGELQASAGSGTIYPDDETVNAALATSGSFAGMIRMKIAGRTDLREVHVVRGPDLTRLFTIDDRHDRIARIEAEEQRAATEEYLARLGHELRTPLNAVLGFAQLLDLEDLEGSPRESVGHILIAGRHMATLLDEVLDLARVRGGGIDLDVGAVNVLDVVRGVNDLIAPLANKRGIVRYVEPAEPAVALADRTRLWQVVLNLVSNAVKYGRDGGTLRIGVTLTPTGRTRIEVEDDGPGMVADALDRIFRPFDRLGAERSGIEGTGLGLALAKALVTAMDGELSAESRPGRGTTMAVELRTVDPADLIDTVEDAEAHPRRSVVHIGADNDTRALVAQAVRTRLGGTVVAVARAELGPDTVRRTQPAVVVISDDLPDGTAVELLQRLGGNPLTALVPVIVLSQEASDLRALMRMRAAGAAAVIAVPMDIRELLDAIGRFLDHAS